jgi:hypothetical protein
VEKDMESGLNNKNFAAITVHILSVSNWSNQKGEREGGITQVKILYLHYKYATVH